MAKKRNVIELTQQEEDIITAMRKQPIAGFAYFTDWFMRGEDTGSWITPEEDDFMLDAKDRYSGGKVTMYEYLRDEWFRQGRPDFLTALPPMFAAYYLRSVPYQVEIDGGDPHFFWKHGWIPLEWGAMQHYAKQKEHTILGGFGCSKTSHVGMSGFTYCATTPRFRFVCVASYLSNAKPMYQEIVNAIEDTDAMKFVGKSRNGEYLMTESPNPRIRFYNGSEMLFLGADKDLGKVRSESGDWYVLEQSESHSDLDAVMLELGTRGRGRVRGRKRLGRLTFVANSGESPQLWDRFDKAEEEERVYWSINLSSYMNAWLSEEDIEKLERSCGGDPDTISQYMKGLKPIGKFKSFPKGAVLRCQDESLDTLMKSLMSNPDSDAREIVENPIGHTLWSLPPRKNRDYAVYGDPGTGNPPARGAGTVWVMDETDFPKVPASLAHFHWVAGDGRIGPWINAFEDAVNRYNAHGRAYYEGTGDQKMLDELSFEDRGLIAQRVNMSGVKYGYFLKTLRVMEKGMMRWPKKVSPIRVQMSKYDIDKDKATSTLPQDIVMTIIIVGAELSKRFIPTVKTEKKGAGKRAIRGTKRKAYKRARRVYRGNRSP